MKESWVPIEGFEGYYEISNLGRVASLIGKNGIRKKPRILKSHIKKNGYFTVLLQMNKRKKTISVHRLVAKAFCKNPKNKPHVNHINFIMTDNRAENLEWVTVKENRKHSNLADHDARKMTREKVFLLRNLYSTGRYDFCNLAKKFSISPNSARAIVNRKAWGHV